MPWFSSELNALSVVAYFPYVKIPSWEDVITPFASTMEQRVSYQDAPVYVHEIGLANLADAEVADLLDFFNAHAGRAVPFKWVDPDGSTLYVRFNQKALPLQKRHANNWILNGNLSLREVHPSEIIVDE